MTVSLTKRFFTKLSRKTYRDAYVAEHVRTGVAYQIRAMREGRDMSQRALAKEMGKPQPVIARLEDPDYGKLTVQTLLAVASAFNVALLIQFVSFPEFLRRTRDVSPADLNAESFDEKQFKPTEALIPEDVLEEYESERDSAPSEPASAPEISIAELAARLRMNFDQIASGPGGSGFFSPTLAVQSNSIFGDIQQFNNFVPLMPFGRRCDIEISDLRRKIAEKDALIAVLREMIAGRALTQYGEASVLAVPPQDRPPLGPAIGTPIIARQLQ